jgi:hypothetical protein
MTTQQMASSTDLASLAMRARDAYDQKRTKECLTLTKSLLMLDPENGDAKSLQSAIRSDIQRNLDDARTLLEDSRRNDNLLEHRKAAEILLLKILYLDPDHDEAKKILASTKEPGTPSWTHATGTAFAAPATAPIAAPVHATKSDVSESAEPVFAVEYRKVEKPAAKSPRRKLPLVLAALVLLAGVLIVTAQSHFKNLSEAPVPASAQSKQPVVQTAPAILPVANSYPEITVSDVAQPAAQTAKEFPAPPVEVAPPPRPAAPPVVPGTLAISSPTSAEIYEGEKYLGSTPITLELTPGNHNLEYRHGDQRQFITHAVKPRETTTAMVTFDVTVQINARPWAQVSIEGAQRRSLGQTPLSDVRVPIGSVLVFENPNFPAKTYRVTSKDTAIRMVFP